MKNAKANELDAAQIHFHHRTPPPRLLAFKNNPFLQTSLDGFVAKHILSDFGNQCYRATGTGGANRLIRTLATGGSAEVAAEFRLARLGQMRQPDCHVSIGTTDDYNFIFAHIGKKLIF